MFELVDTLVEKRRLVLAGAAVILPLLVLSLLAPVVHAHQADMAAQVQASQASQATPTFNDDTNAVSGVLSQVADSSGKAMDSAKVTTLSGIMSAADGVTHVNKTVAHGASSATGATLRGIGSGAAGAAHVVGGGFSLTGRIIGDTLGFAADMTHISSLIRPADSMQTPTITKIRAEQATIIQSGTTNVAVAAVNNGTGGACDSGQGNGSYPLVWCDAPMDSALTITYSGDRINRECTSYAFWYFTSVEGHSDFHVSGNAKYWAGTSNYPTHATPAIGAIAVETYGAYGHVAIVQALPGQTFDGQVVPAGDVLVSEMNYDWQGHFRYSYSPVSKFTAYIYP